MTSFGEFCLHYDLCADDPDAQLQFSQYQEAYQTLMAAAGGDGDG